MDEHSPTSAFTPTCPSCPDGIGFATNVKIGGGMRTIAFRCKACQHAWETTEHASGSLHQRDTTGPETLNPPD